MTTIWDYKHYSGGHFVCYGDVRIDSLASKVESGYSLTGKTLAMVRDIRRLHEGS